MPTLARLVQVLRGGNCWKKCNAHITIVCRQDITEHRNLLMQLGSRSRGIQLMTSVAHQPSNMQNFGRAMSVIQPGIESMESRLQEAN